MNEPVTSPQQIWQSQPVEENKMSAEVIRRRAGKFQRRIQRRNILEYVSAVVAAVMMGYFAATNHHPLFRFAYGLFIAGLAWMSFQLHRKGSARSLTSAMGSSTCVQFFRSELERQRDAVSSVWSWYLAPMVPGFVVLTAATLLTLPFPASLPRIAVMDGAVAAVFVFVWKINQRAARCLQRMIDELSVTDNSP